jgi:glucokinase
VWIVAGDIGGTSTRLALYEQPEAGELRTVKTERFSSPAYGDLTTIVREFLEDAPGPVDRAGFGVAGPVHDDTAQATNLPWVLDARVLERDLGITRVRLVNDFHAVALGIGELGPDDLAVLQDQPTDPGGPVAILGAGTGLGEAIVVPDPQGGPPRVLASEGGHTDFAPRNETEIDLLRFLLQRHHRVSVERVVSGPGLHALYDFVVHTGRATTADAIKNRLTREDPGKVIGEAALAGTDPACTMAVELFLSAYGAEAGNLALKLLPTGGLFIAGGIAPQLLSRLREGPFMPSFRQKGRMTPLLDRTRVSVVLNTRIGLLGAKVAALTSE